MHELGHRGAAMLGYAPVIALLPPRYRWLAVLGLPLSLLGARVPDIDQRLPFVPHRGPTHTIWFAVFLSIGVAGIVRSIGPTAPAAISLVTGAAVGIGILSHLVADAFTIAGIRPFWPLWDRAVSVARFRAGDPRPNWGLFLSGLTAIALVLAGTEIPIPADLIEGVALVTRGG